MGELLEEGAPIEWRNSSKYTPLMWAAGHRNESVVGKLVDWSAYRNLAGRGHHAVIPTGVWRCGTQDEAWQAVDRLVSDS